MRWIWRCSSFALFSLSLLLSVSHSLSHFPPFDPWPLFFLAGYTVYISASSRPTAPCQYHPSGTTSHSLHCSPKKECQYRPCGKPPCHQCWGPCWSWTIPEAHAYDHTDGTFWTAPNHLGMATSTMQTVTSCIINTVSRCFSGTQAQHAGTPPRLLQRLAVGFMRLSYKKPVFMCSQVSDQFIAYTSDRPCHLAPQGHFRAQRCSLFLTKLRQARTRGVWQFFWFEGFCDALPFPAPPRLLFALSTSTMLRPRNAMPPLICSDGCTHT